MKPFAVTLLIVIVYLSFTPRVFAQCVDYASCIGDRAEIDARLRPWAQETAQAKAEERRATAEAIADSRQATAEARQLSASATEIARAINAEIQATNQAQMRATMTPQPSATSLPTATNTPQPAATVTAVAPTVVTVVVYAAPVTAKQSDLPQWSWWVIGAIGVGIILFTAAGLRKPTTR